MKVISVIHDEFKTIAGSYAILLVLMGGIFVYGLLYGYRLSGSPGYDEVGQGGWYSLSAG